MVMMYDDPDSDLLKASSYTLWSCKRSRQLTVINVKHIVSVVGMVPHPRADGQLGNYHDGPVFRIEKMGLDAAILTGTVESAEDSGEPAD